MQLLQQNEQLTFTTLVRLSSIAVMRSRAVRTVGSVLATTAFLSPCVEIACAGALARPRASAGAGVLGGILNAYVERFIQSMQVECFDRFLGFGEKHFDYLVREYVEHYCAERPHQGLGNRTVAGQRPPTPPDDRSTVTCECRLGGLLRHYHREATCVVLAIHTAGAIAWVKSKCVFSNFQIAD